VSTGAGFEGRLPCGRWSVWRYNWLANHKLIRGLERVRRHAHGTLLDVGCGSRAFAPLFRGHAARYLGLDLPGSPEYSFSRPDVYGDALELPVRSASVDTVLSLSTLEQVQDPARALAEVRRVLAPGGVAILEFIQVVPVYPRSPDLWRFTGPGVEHMLRGAGLEPVEIVRMGRAPGYVGLAVLLWLNRFNRGPLRVLTELPVRLLYLLVQGLAEALDWCWAGSDEVMSRLVVARAAGTLHDPAAAGAGPGSGRSLTSS
jgi:SAM-dependent methyltransferase